MFRRVLPCLFLAAAGMISNGQVHAQESGLKSSLIDDQDSTPPGQEPDQTAAAPPKPTSLTVNPLPESPPPPKKRKPDDDPFAPTGIDMGQFLVYPAVKVGGVYTDNVAQSHANRQDDIGLRLRPSLRVESDWVRHSFSINADGDFSFYNAHPDDNTATASAAARLRLDVRRGTEATLEANYYLSQNTAGTSDVPGNAIGSRTDHTYELAASLDHDLGRITTRFKTGIIWQTYDDVKLAGGGKEDNSDLNYYEPEIVFRTGYNISPAFTPYVEAAYRPRFHDVTPDRNGLNRDSNGYSLSAGIAFEPSPIWSGDLALIYLLRDYDDPSLATLDSVGATGRITWRPTDITAVTLTTGTALDETSLDGSSGSRDYTAGLDISHELREDLILNGGGGVELNDYQGIDLDELTVTGRLGLIWRLSRFVALTGDYDFTWYDSTTKDSDYIENRITAGIEVRH